MGGTSNYTIQDSIVLKPRNLSIRCDMTAFAANTLNNVQAMLLSLHCFSEKLLYIH